MAATYSPSKAVSAYWARMSPEERAAENARRAKKREATRKRNKKANRERVTTRIPLHAVPKPRKNAAQELTPEEKRERYRKYREAAKAKREGKHLPVAVFNGHSNGNGKQQAALADKVYAEYDVSADQMTLVMGKLRLALRVKA